MHCKVNLLIHIGEVYRREIILKSDAVTKLPTEQDVIESLEQELQGREWLAVYSYRVLAGSDPELTYRQPKLIRCSAIKTIYVDGIYEVAPDDSE